MNVKKYRAATMREALEQVKNELGEEALVLGSKSLKRKGFLGFGSREMVEVRVSTEFINGNLLDKPAGSKNRKPTFTSLSLNPNNTSSITSREPRNAAFTALAARAYASEAKPANIAIPASTRPVIEPTPRPVETVATNVVVEPVAKSTTPKET